MNSTTASTSCASRPAMSCPPRHAFQGSVDDPAALDGVAIARLCDHLEGEADVMRIDVFA